ncbi:passenger-associated-transport-repeat domain-containing protein [Ditylenchus destructor]|uniref:Passenger-associated-transport-repeat domain-containing protein n=1 Tax=Ditylenchus destructor TaxID=166010 RepID=A0AAD4QSR7_9BILA|nr:passenger-associated-transport-repeat domain-containing protein [Ditylenchus destructor]
MKAAPGEARVGSAARAANTSTGITGGAGGATPGAHGANGTGGGTGSRATGGGGGAHGAVLNSMAFLGGAISGGNGGNGGTSNDGDGGGGGAGGYGVVIDANVAGTFSFSVAIAGGDGGLGGNGYFWGGGGGDGGHGLVFATAASAELNAPVSGGNAGFGGTFLAGGCCKPGQQWRRRHWRGGARRDAHDKCRGERRAERRRRDPCAGAEPWRHSRLSLGSGWSLSGDIRIVDGRLNFLQDSDLSLGNAISGGGMLIKSGTGILTLSGTNSYTGGTRVEAGTLSMGSAAALATASIWRAGSLAPAP